MSSTFATDVAETTDTHTPFGRAYRRHVILLKDRVCETKQPAQLLGGINSTATALAPVTVFLAPLLVSRWTGGYPYIQKGKRKPLLTDGE